MDKRKEDALFKKKIAQSDKRIADAIAVLSEHDRGRRVLRAFRKMCEDGAAGLDSVNMRMLVRLVKEVACGRREFVNKL